MFYSICIDNQDVVDVPEVCINWEVPFLNRFFDKNKAKEMYFVDNGKNWQYTDSDESLRTINLDVYLDDNDHIKELSIYKYRPTSFHHGKNTSDELKVLVSDEKFCAGVLKEVVPESAETELEELLVKTGNTGFSKERKLSVQKNSITILDANGQKQTIKKTSLIKALQISHVYPEILYDDTIFTHCPKDYPQKIWSVLHEILAYVDTEKYYRFAELKKEMEARRVFATADENYPKLFKAVKKGDLEETNRLAGYARLVPYRNPEKAPLYYAAKKDRTDIAKVLLENGAYATETALDGSGLPLEIAYKVGNRKMIQLIAEHHGAKVKRGYHSDTNIDKVLKACAKNRDYEAIEWMAADAFKESWDIWMKPELFGDLDDEALLEISKHPKIRIAWDLAHIRPLYERKEFDLCRQLLLQGSHKEVVEFFLAENDFDMFKASLARHTALDENGKYEPGFERDKKWYDCLCEHTYYKTLGGKISSRIIETRDKFYIKLLDNEEFDRYIRSLKLLEVQERELYGSLGNYRTIYYPEKCKNRKGYRDFANYMLDHYELTKRYSFLEAIVKYFGDDELVRKFNEKCPLKQE